MVTCGVGWATWGLLCLYVCKGRERTEKEGVRERKRTDRNRERKMEDKEKLYGMASYNHES